MPMMENIVNLLANALDLKVSCRHPLISPYIYEQICPPGDRFKTPLLPGNSFDRGIEHQFQDCLNCLKGDK